MLLIALFLFVVAYRRSIDEKYRGHSSKEIYLRELASNYQKHEMEVDKRNIKMYEKLGEGAFGVVRRGALLPHNIDVAVKMLKGLRIHHFSSHFIGRKSSSLDPPHLDRSC